jgi:hypothetical protein
MEIQMKTLFVLPVLMLVGLVSHAPTAQAQGFGAYPWCSQYDGPSEARSCSFSTRGQCMQTVTGIGGYCYRNPDYGYARRRQY